MSRISGESLSRVLQDILLSTETAAPQEQPLLGCFHQETQKPPGKARTITTRVTRLPNKIGTVPIFRCLSCVPTDLWSLRRQHSAFLFFFCSTSGTPLPCVPIFFSSHLVTLITTELSDFPSPQQERNQSAEGMVWVKSDCSWLKPETVGRALEQSLAEAGCEILVWIIIKGLSLHSAAQLYG